MLAIEESASSFCAREMRGTLSIASTVALRAASASISCGFCAGQMKLTRVAPSRIRARRPVAVVREVRRVAGAALHRDAESELDQLLDHLGHGGDALFARGGLARDANQLPGRLRHRIFP